MKTGLHPKWFNQCKVTCVCGNTFNVGSTKEEIRTEICHKCHPFFTGEMKFVDTLGRVEKFQIKQKKAVESRKILEDKKQKKKEEQKKRAKQPKSLREMLLSLK